MLRRIFGDGENPFSWAFPLFTLAGIRVKVHVIFIILVISQLIWSASRDTVGLGYMATGMAILFLIVLLHEFGHCIACRMVKGEADEILMWPLGGLAMCRPPETWRAHLVTAVGGPLVNVALAPILGAALLAVGGGWESVLFNPFQPTRPLSVMTSWGMVTLWWAYYTNLLLLGFNVLVPMYPMDGGRILQCVLWSRLGLDRSMDIATRVGIVVAAALFILGMVGGQTTLMAVAIFGGMTCWFERKRLAFARDAGGMGLTGMITQVDRRERLAYDRAAKAQAQERADRAEVQREVDRILAKISREGLGSLSKKERQTLERASKSD